MGSPLGPSLANAFLAHHEFIYLFIYTFFLKNWLESRPLEYKPSYYRRYVDDKFVLSKSSDHFLQFHSYLNSCHVNVTFTVETEQNNKISFLDLKFIKSGIYTHFDSFLHNTYKIDMIYTLVNMYVSRYVLVCQCSINI